MLVVVSAALGAILAACGGGGGASDGARTPGAARTAVPTAIAASGGAGTGFLIVSKPEGLGEYDIAKKKSRTLIANPTPDTFLLDPAVSRDGAMLTYVVQPPPIVEGGKYDAGSDVWVANRDGSGARAVFTHIAPNQLARFPQFEDAAHILAIVQELTVTSGATKVDYKLERIDVATGQRSDVLTNVLAFGLSPDAKRAAFAQLAPQTGETLQAVELGGAPTTLVGLEQNLSPFNSPRYSPDGSKVAFSSADQTGAVAPRRPGYALASFAPMPAPPADGLPEDIWVVDAAGGTPTRVADIKEDLPALSWSGDGRHIYVIGSQALYDVDLTNGAVDRIGEGAFHAQIVWTP